MSQELTGYLAELSAAGEHDSRGVFTTDAQRALQMLSARLFADPLAYLAKWMQAAWLAGAIRVECKTGKDQLSMRWPRCERPPLWSDLEAAFKQPLETPADSALRPLVLCLHALNSQVCRPGDLRTQATLAAAGRSWKLTPAGLELCGGAEGGAEGVSDAVVLTVRRPGGWSAERAALERRCSLSPVLLEWDGKPVNGQPLGVPGSPERKSFPYLLDKLYLSTDPADELLALPHLTLLPAAVYDAGAAYQDTYSFGPTLMQLWRSYVPRHAAPLFPAGPLPGYRVQESSLTQELFGLPTGAYALNHGRIRPGRLQGSNNGYQILYVDSLAPHTRAGFTLSQGRFGRQAPPAARAWLRCPSLPATGGSLHLQHQGVLLDPLEVEWPLAGAALLVSDPQAATDLSGLTPLQGERLAALTEWFRADMQRSKKDLRKALRWHEKFGMPDAEAARLAEVHQLQDDGFAPF